MYWNLIVVMIAQVFGYVKNERLILSKECAIWHENYISPEINSKETNNLTGKMGKRSEQTLHHRRGADGKQARGSTPSVIREKQIKSRLRCN